MKAFRKTLLTVVLLSVLTCVSHLVAQDTNVPDKAVSPPAGQMDPAAMMNMMMELGKPGENHKILADMAGTWTNQITFWMSPDTNMPPTISYGSTVTKPIMGGRYFISEHKSIMAMPGADGKLKDMDFNGMQIGAYDNVKKEFVTTWIDSMGTGIMVFEGSYDAAAKAFTYTADDESFPGVKSKVREVVKVTDHNHHTMEYYENQGGHEVKSMEITYTRLTPAP